MDSLSHLLSTESPSCADLGLMHPTPTPKQLAAAAAYVSELEASLVAANDEVARLRLKAADRDQWQEVAMKARAEADTAIRRYESAKEHYECKMNGPERVSRLEAERDRYLHDSNCLDALNHAVMCGPTDARISDLLPGKWPDLRTAIERNLMTAAA
jgi:hypothetical protein